MKTQLLATFFFFLFFSFSLNKERASQRQRVPPSFLCAAARNEFNRSNNSTTTTTTTTGGMINDFRFIQTGRLFSNDPAWHDDRLPLYLNIVQWAVIFSNEEKKMAAINFNSLKITAVAVRIIITSPRENADNHFDGSVERSGKEILFFKAGSSRRKWRLALVSRRVR